MSLTTTKAVKVALSKAKAKWRAAPTPQSLLPLEDRKRLLGAEPSPEVATLLRALKTSPPMATAPAFAPMVDWRNKNGNHITPVKNQGGCGSCVSFGSAGLIESMAHIEKGVWLDLSEADSHFCSSHGASCGGWWPDQCLDQIKARGICDEAGFPYPSAFPNNDIWQGPPHCSVAPNRAQSAVKINARQALADPTAVKNYLSNTGPVTGCFTVYNDFFHYSGGVYHHVTGAKEGGHCVLVIGYSEVEQCWIVKNSWDVTWGVGGFGKIAYADFLYDGQFYPMYGATGVITPTAGWQSLGGGIIGEPVIGRNKDGRLEAFVRGMDNGLWHTWQNQPGGSWSGWASLGGRITSEPCVLSNADGRMEVFARGTDNALWHLWQTAPNNGWSGWASLGGVITSDPAAGRNKDGRMEVFARGTDGALWHLWQVAPSSGWSGWTSLGTHFNGRPVVTNNADGRLEVFMIGTNNSLVHQWQVAPNGAWSGWSSLGGAITSLPSANRNKDGRIEVVARGTNGALFHIWQTAPNNGWSGWASLGGVITTNPVLSINADGRLEAFARGTDSALWHIWQTSPGGNWSGWSSLGGGISADPAVGINKDGRMETFVRGLDNALWHRWQTAPSNGWN